MPAAPSRSSTPTEIRTSSAPCSSPIRWRHQGGGKPDAARALADYLLSPEVEAALANGPSAQIPLLKSTAGLGARRDPKTVHAMEVDFEAAAKVWNKVAAFLTEEFAG